MVSLVHKPMEFHLSCKVVRRDSPFLQVRRRPPKKCGGCFRFGQGCVVPRIHKRLGTGRDGVNPLAWRAEAHPYAEFSWGEEEVRNTSLIQEQCLRIREEGDLGYNVFLTSYLPAQGQGLVFECSEERATKESEGQAHQILTKKWELQGPGAKTDRVACNTEVVRACLPFIMEMTADNTLSEDGCLETIMYTRLRGKKIGKQDQRAGAEIVNQQHLPCYFGPL